MAAFHIEGHRRMNDEIDKKTEERIAKVLGAMMRAENPEIRLVWASIANELMNPVNRTIH